MRSRIVFEKKSTAQEPARPVQRRGMERRRAILDAAEALLDEQGYEAATLKAVGERAGIPIASVYHCLPDRFQVDAALLQRHVEELDRLIGIGLEGREPRTLREAADAAIDPVRDCFRRHPSSTELWFSAQSATVTDLVRAFDEAQTERFLHLLVERRLIAADTPPLVLQVAYEAGIRLLDIAFRATKDGDDATIDEACRLVTAHLETYAPWRSPGGTSRRPRAVVAGWSADRGRRISGPGSTEPPSPRSRPRWPRRRATACRTDSRRRGGSVREGRAASATMRAPAVPRTAPREGDVARFPPRAFLRAAGRP
ncbi:TetR/AcrR family transcriptional regulator [Streptomyces flavochromogenes]|uniref:TetR/AcrR family transcriptional regulator n=1 Tax=Streptomyces flavochromogenes TaxID=68199 RepID=UPI001FD8590A|nr:TetR/AcrR family transcriptional regulator [Streptomyces flavochromogenes]